jgi:hypothetical protein
VLARVGVATRRFERSDVALLEASAAECRHGSGARLETPVLRRVDVPSAGGDFVSCSAGFVSRTGRTPAAGDVLASAIARTAPRIGPRASCALDFVRDVVRVGSGENRVVSERPGIESGGPEILSGEPGIVSGEHGIVSGRPELVSGGSEIVSGEPELARGGPEVVSGEPELVSGGPELVSGGPELVRGGSGIVSGGPEIVSVRPEIAIHAMETVIGGNRTASGGIEIGTDNA